MTVTSVLRPGGKARKEICVRFAGGKEKNLLLISCPSLSRLITIKTQKNVNRKSRILNGTQRTYLSGFKREQNNNFGIILFWVKKK